MRSITTIICFSLVAAIAATRAGEENTVELEVDSDGPAADEKASAFIVGDTCDAQVQGPEKINIRKKFDDKRKNAKILYGNKAVETVVDLEALSTMCTKKDTCHLMRQMDMNFYNKGIEGTVTQSEAETPLTTVFTAYKDCHHEKVDSTLEGRGFPVQDVRSAEECIDLLRKADPVWSVASQGGALTEGQVASGCYYKKKAPLDRKDSKYKDCESAYEPKVKACNAKFREDSKAHGKIAEGFWNPTHEIVYKTGSAGMKSHTGVCLQNRGLSQAQSVYYSPYKMKASMIAGGTISNSASCSFGEIASMYRDRETGSACARILAYRRKEGELSAEEEVVHQAKNKAKYNLMEIFANRWCREVWEDAMAAGAVCKAERLMDWQKRESHQPRVPKQALNEESCESITDENFLDAVADLDSDGKQALREDAWSGVPDF